MNRTFSSSFKSNASKCNKKIAKHNCSSINFQTIIKTRDSHSVLKNIKPSLKKQISNLSQGKTTHEQLSQSQLEKSHELKNYVKAINKSNEDWGMPKFRQSCLIQSQTDQNESSSMMKCKSQPKLGKMSSSESVPHLPFINMSIEDLSKKVQQLLELKLLRKCKTRNFMSLRTYEDELQKDLRTLIQQLKQYQTVAEPDNNNKIDFDIKEIAQKISVIEKIIAESFTESEVLKKYFFMKKFNRKPLAILESKQLRQTFAGDMPAIRYPSYVGEYPSLHYSTTSQTSYSKPDRQAYQRDIRRDKTFHPNRQNLGHSTYQTDFLNYGSLPKYPSKNLSQLHTMGTRRLNQNNSIYQSDFKPKKVELIDSKELDCRNDKFKPTQISFMPKKMMEMKETKKENNKKSLKHTFIFEKTKDMSSSVIPTSNLFKQQGMRQSDWEINYAKRSQYSDKFSGDKAILECLVKQTNLSNLKYQFKKIARA